MAGESIAIVPRLEPIEFDPASKFKPDCCQGSRKLPYNRVAFHREGQDYFGKVSPRHENSASV
jgi:hypothetical protein